MKIKLLTAIMLICFTVLPDATYECEVKDTWIKDEYVSYIYEISESYEICPELIMAIIETESSGNPNACNKGCKGLMQISTKWHKERMKRLEVTDIYDPYSNILVGVDYISELASDYSDVALVLMLYNGQSDAFKKAEKGEISYYAEYILERSAELERLHGK